MKFSMIRRSFPIKITEASNGDAQVTIRGRNYSPAEISSMILDEDEADRR